jgi:hypothetical protein
MVLVLRKYSSNLGHKNVIKNNKGIMVINVLLGAKFHTMVAQKKSSAIDSKGFFWNKCDNTPNVEGKRFGVAIF